MIFKYLIVHEHYIEKLNNPENVVQRGTSIAYLQFGTQKLILKTLLVYTIIYAVVKHIYIIWYLLHN